MLFEVEVVALAQLDLGVVVVEGLFGEADQLGGGLERAFLDLGDLAPLGHLVQDVRNGALFDAFLGGVCLGPVVLVDVFGYREYLLVFGDYRPAADPDLALEVLRPQKDILFEWIDAGVHPVFALQVVVEDAGRLLADVIYLGPSIPLSGSKFSDLLNRISRLSAL